MEKFLELFKEALEIEGREIKPGDTFKDYDEWDSIGLLSIIAMIDEEYDVTFDSNELENAETLAELYELVQTKTP